MCKYHVQIVFANIICIYCKYSSESSVQSKHLKILSWNSSYSTITYNSLNSVHCYFHRLETMYRHCIDFGLISKKALTWLVKEMFKPTYLNLNWTDPCEWLELGSVYQACITTPSCGKILRSRLSWSLYLCLVKLLASQLNRHNTTTIDIWGSKVDRYKSEISKTKLGNDKKRAWSYFDFSFPININTLEFKIPKKNR